MTISKMMTKKTGQKRKSEGDILNLIKEDAKKYFSQAKNSHDWEHTERVYKLCLEIAKNNGVNFFNQLNNEVEGIY